MTKQSKRFRALATQRTDDAVPLATAVEKLKKFGNTKFDQTVEIHMRLGVDPKQADQIIRGSVVLPHGIGKTQRVVCISTAHGLKFTEFKVQYHESALGKIQSRHANPAQMLPPDYARVSEAIRQRFSAGA